RVGGAVLAGSRVVGARAGAGAPAEAAAGAEDEPPREPTGDDRPEDAHDTQAPAVHLLATQRAGDERTEEADEERADHGAAEHGQDFHALTEGGFRLVGEEDVQESVHGLVPPRGVSPGMSKPRATSLNQRSYCSRCP